MAAIIPAREKIGIRTDSLKYREKSFTLIELVVVIGILAVAAGIIMPSLENLSPRYRLISGARYLASKVEMLMDEAVSDGRTLYITYDLNNHAYWFFVPVVLTETGAVSIPAEDLMPNAMPENVKIKRLKFPDGSVYSSGVHSVEFNALRTEGTHVVVLENEQEKQISVKVNAYSGIVSFFEEEIEFHEYTEEGE